MAYLTIVHNNNLESSSTFSLEVDALTYVQIS